MPRNVLLTGAAGAVARLLLPGLVESGRAVRLVDRVPVEVGPGAELDVRVGDLTDRAVAAEVTAGMDAVVHLAANPNPAASWDELVGPNVEMVDAVLAAAYRSGVTRVVLASSVHAMGVYAMQGQTPVDPGWPPSPCCPYGATKVLAEALGRTYAYRTGLSVICLRLGGPEEIPRALGTAAAWLAPTDLRQLVACALDASVEFGIYHGTSANAQAEWNLDNARKELGYAPVGDSETLKHRITPDERRGLCYAYQAFPLDRRAR